MPIKDFFKSIAKRYKQENKDRKDEAIRTQAREKFQVTEYLNEFWITYEGMLFCPCRLFNCDDAITTLAKLRYEYIKRMGAA